MNSFKNKLKYVLILFFYLLSFSIFQISNTPLFENFDEIGHFSAIRQIAYEGAIPNRDNSFLDVHLSEYSGPTSYGSGTPPFDSGFVYKKFFEEDYSNTYNEKYYENKFPTYQRSKIINTEYQQQPAGYYLLMSKIYQPLANKPLMIQVLTLRIISSLIAIFGILIAFYSTLKYCVFGNYQSTILGYFIYAFLFPMLIPEFSRIGNDSLCLLLIGIIYSIFIRDRLFNNSYYLLLCGIFIGIGLSTKAFFLPILVAVSICLIYQNILSKLKLKLILKNILLILIPAFIFGGFWYFYSYIYYGSFTGANLAMQFNAIDGGTFSLINKNFSLAIFLRGLLVIPVTFVWGGTLSLMHLPLLLYIPFALPFIYILYKVTINYKYLISNEVSRLAFVVLLLMLCGLIWHAFVNLISGGGNSNTPGWYLHILLPFLAPLIGFCMRDIYVNKSIRIVFFSLCIYSMLFFTMVSWFQATLFSGFSTKGLEKNYLFLSDNFYIDQYQLIFTRINLLSFQNLLFVSFFAWFLFSLVILFFLFYRNNGTKKL